jgi:carbonic anhydrase
MSATDELIERNKRHAEAFENAGLTAPPRKKVAVVSCMDARVNPHTLLGLADGDAHVIRNAGGVVTDEVIRSLALSQHKLGTREVMVIGHSDCGLEGLDSQEFGRDLDDHAKAPRDWSIAAFADVDQSVRDSIGKISASPFLHNDQSVRGFVYDVTTGLLREVQ